MMFFFENERRRFNIGICDSEGAFNQLYGIEKYNSETTIENVKSAINNLKKVLEKNELVFYLTRNGNLYRKEAGRYTRIKDPFAELLGKE